MILFAFPAGLLWVAVVRFMPDCENTPSVPACVHISESEPAGEQRSQDGGYLLESSV
jgi:hypothetical protein